MTCWESGILANREPLCEKFHKHFLTYLHGLQAADMVFLVW
jgi:hypothetical protein